MAVRQASAGGSREASGRDGGDLRRCQQNLRGCAPASDLRVNSGVDLPPIPEPKRLGPRPLALHMAHAEWAWRAQRPQQLASFYRGIKAYRSHPYRRSSHDRPVVWQEDGCRLVDYGPEDGWPLLVVPSLINRAYILDLMPGASLLEFFRDHGLRPLLVDWDDRTRPQRRFTLNDLILDLMDAALDWIRRATARRPLVLGYCMGGTLATALACLRQERMAGLALLAAPWDFDHHIRDEGQSVSCFQALASCAGLVGSAPVDLLQVLFAQIDPLNVPRKLARLADLPPTSATAMRVVAIEDWLNDGVPLSAEVAAACFLDWYGGNAPARGDWLVDGTRIKPEHLVLPVCLAIPEHDRIVPPASALGLDDILPRCELIRPKGGHVSMVVGFGARTELWDPLLKWLKRIAAMQKKPW